ncbi:hypothetical protein [Pararhodospirillum photometricum]|nr:hypothetical protein [Pararhodospirillum photometricum]
MHIFILHPPGAPPSPLAPLAAFPQTPLAVPDPATLSDAARAPVDEGC